MSAIDERPRLTPAVFDFNVMAAVATIECFISAKMNELGRAGIVVPLSGGLDSSTVTALCARAVGAERVIGLILRDRKVFPTALRFGHVVAERLGVKAVEVDVTRLNRAGGVYGYRGYLLPAWILARLARWSRARRGYNVIIASMRGTDRRTRDAFVPMNARQRLRMVATYRYAEAHRLLVVGAAQRTELLLGLFVTFGVDDAADLMPLKRLYRTQIVPIARAVGVPEEVIARSPSAEMLPGDADKYLDVGKVPVETIDLILWGIEHDMADAEIARDVAVDTAKVGEIREMVRLTAHMRDPSQCPDLNGAPTV